MAQMQAAPAADPSVLAAIAAMFGGQQPQAAPSSPVLDGLPAAIRQMQVGPQADPAAIAPAPMPAGGPAPGPAPMAAPPPQTAPAPSAGPPAGAPMLSAPQGPPSGAPSLPPPPMIQPTNHIGDVLDSITGGHFAYARRQEYAQQLQNYSLARTQSIANSITDPVARRLFLADPSQWAKAVETTQEAANVDAGNSRYIPGQGFVTAPKLSIDEATGKPIVETVSGTTAGPSLGGDFTLDPTTGAVISKRTGLTTQAVGVPTKMAPGERIDTTIAPTVGGPGGPPAGAPLLSDGGAGTAPTAPATPSNGSVSARNNNPGNVRPAPDGKWQGQVGVSPQGFAVFDTPQNGARALAINLANKQKLHGLKTPAQIIGDPTNGWAPNGVDGNQSAPYAAFVAKRLGVTPNSPIDLSDPHTLSTAAQAISDYEGGPGSGPLQTGASPPLIQGAAPGGASATAGAPRLGAPGAVPGVNAPGTHMGQTTGGGYRILTADQVPNGKKNWTYKVAPNGDLTPIPPDFSQEIVQGNRKSFYGSEAYQAAQSGIAPLKALSTIVDSVAPGGVISTAAMDTFMKGANPGGVVRPTTVQMFMDHMGLPEDLKSKVINATGNGFISPKVVKQIGQSTWLYARAHTQLAADNAQKDTDLAVAHGFSPTDVGETAPAMPPVPLWAQDHPPAPAQRKVGSVYWGPKGPGIWTGKGWTMQ